MHTVSVLFENDSWLVVDKPAMWLTVPSRQGEDDSRPCLGRVLEQEHRSRLFPTHRLDEEVSGVTLFAKTHAAHRDANGWFERHDVRKRYIAHTEGVAATASLGTVVEWRAYLVRGKKRAFVAPHGKLAITRALFLGVANEGLRFALEPLTGRSHQLRVHLATHGFPIVGDRLYGAHSDWLLPGIGLRAAFLDFSGCPASTLRGLPQRIAVAEGCSGPEALL